VIHVLSSMAVFVIVGFVGYCVSNREEYADD